jgi:hypothetical protein
VNPAVAVRITPEPTPEEREALIRALAKLDHPDGDGVSPWWQAGIREAVDGEPEERE